MASRDAYGDFRAARLADDPETLYDQAPSGYLSTTPDGVVHTLQTGGAYPFPTGVAQVGPIVIHHLAGRQIGVVEFLPPRRIVADAMRWIAYANAASRPRAPARRLRRWCCRRRSTDAFP